MAEPSSKERQAGIQVSCGRAKPNTNKAGYKAGKKGSLLGVLD